MNNNINILILCCCFVLIITSSCSLFEPKQKTIIDKSCDEYKFVLHFLDDLMVNPNNIDNLLIKYPIYSDDDLNNNKTYLVQQAFLISKLYKKNKNDFKLTDIFCFENLNHPFLWGKYDYRHIEVHYEIKPLKKRIFVRFIQYEKGMFLDFVDIAISDFSKK